MDVSDYPIEPIQWPEYWVTLIVQRLTGTEAAQFILGAAFGCILRHWGPHFWEMRLRSETRYNWVAISLAGLLLLTAAIPYIERQLGGLIGLKTPFAEFQFAGKGKGILPLEKDFQVKLLTNLETLQLMTFSNYNIGIDLKYIELFPKDPMAEHKEIYKPKRTIY